MHLCLTFNFIQQFYIYICNYKNKHKLELSVNSKQDTATPYICLSPLNKVELVIFHEILSSVLQMCKASLLSEAI